MIKFKVNSQSDNARRGTVQTTRGEIQTPFFMPVGTVGSVKAMKPEEVKELGAEIILSNTYHLHLRPGDKVVQKLGGLHKFMNWPHPILTDSGGFQVFSLAKLSKKSEEGVVFQSHLNGDTIVLTPEKAIEIQQNLGSDIMMCFDECPALPSTHSKLQESINLTTRWAQRCKSARSTQQGLFGIVQGGLYKDLRLQSLESLVDIGFDGYAIGGLSVGESKEEMYEMLHQITSSFPDKFPRYLMGVGKPEDILEAVETGVDMFDCVLPTRNARNGSLFTSVGRISIKQAKFREDPNPVDPNCSCYVCQNYSRAYLRHLYIAKEILSTQLNTYHNLYFYLNLMKQIRYAIERNQFSIFKNNFLSLYNQSKLG